METRTSMRCDALTILLGYAAKTNLDATSNGTDCNGMGQKFAKSDCKQIRANKKCFFICFLAVIWPLVLGGGLQTRNFISNLNAFSDISLECVDHVDHRVCICMYHLDWKSEQKLNTMYFFQCLNDFLNTCQNIE